MHSDLKAGNTSTGAARPKACKFDSHFFESFAAATIGFYLDLKLVVQTPTPAGETVPMYPLIASGIGGGWLDNPES